jgi:hypothetical protein
MAAEDSGSQGVKTISPGGLVNVDIQVALTSSDGLNFAAVTGTGHQLVDNFDGTGNALTSTGGALDVNLESQTGNISVDVAAFSASPLDVNVQDGAGNDITSTASALHVYLDDQNGNIDVNIAAFAVAVDVNLQDGAGTDLTSTGGALDVNIASGLADPLPVDIDAQSLGSVAVSIDNTPNAVANPLFVELSDGTNAVGTSGNPIYIQEAGGGLVGVPVQKFSKVNIAKEADNAADYSYTAGTEAGGSEDLYVSKIVLHGHESGHVELKNNAVTILWLYKSASEGKSEYKFEEPIKVLNGDVFLAVRTNDGNRAADFTFSFEGSEY